MKKKMVHKPRDKTLIGFVFFSILVVIGMSIGYSALNEELSISGEAYVRVEEDIRVMDIKLVEATNGAYETYNAQYSKDTTSMFVTLPNENSTITYEVTIENKSLIKYQLKDVLEKSYTNTNINYELIGISLNDIIASDSSIIFQIKFSTSVQNQKVDLSLNYLFIEFTQWIIAEANTDFTNNFNTLQINDKATDFSYGYDTYLGINLSTIHVSYSDNRISVFSNEPIDLTNYNTLIFEIRTVTNNMDLSCTNYFGLIDLTTPKDLDESKFAKVESIVKKGTIVSDHILSIDVSDLKGHYFIKAMSIHGGQTFAYSGFTGIKSIYAK